MVESLQIEVSTEDDIFHLLSSFRRRQALCELYENGPMSVADLADRISSLEVDKPVKDVTSQERKRVYVSLYQTHIPKLDKCGLIESDHRRDYVALSGDYATHVIEEYLYRDSNPVPWNSVMFLYALGASVVIAGGLVLGLPHVIIEAAIVGYILADLVRMIHEKYRTDKLRVDL